ncbi:hypothetical protein [Bacillus sp. FJAT-27264]|uniref:hypothetical protein n=1 Tax=Paenibacillus sp. (strain DSM 101736 / FJAT-27264) TaxID=1850362 RepID=UPI001111D421|nr:hypothetical protein [Bacillus sp. FJAT-27264]
MKTMDKFVYIIANGLSGILIFRSILTAFFGVSQSQFISLFVAALCILYSLIFRSMTYKRQNYLFLSNLFSVAAVLSYSFLFLFISRGPGSERPYLLFSLSNELAQKVVVALLLLILGAGILLINRRWYVSGENKGNAK